MFELDEGRDVVDGGERDVAPAAGALRGADQALGGEHAQRLPNRGSADAELAREHGLVRQALSLGELAGHDQLAQLIGDLLVRLAHPAHGHRPRHPLDRP